MPRWNGRYFADDIFKCIFLNENVWIPIKIPLKFVPEVPINTIPALVQIMAWRRSGDKPLYGPMMISLPTHICVTRPQWVNYWYETHSEISSGVSTATDPLLELLVKVQEHDILRVQVVLVRGYLECSNRLNCWYETHNKLSSGVSTVTGPLVQLLAGVQEHDVLRIQAVFVRRDLECSIPN